ncbi:MAG: pyrroloquinoline quinone biosynthesis peptide chaperone PqqD [Pseudomonadota bacterium]
MITLSLPSLPSISRHFRLQWEEAQQCYVLLYPEGMVKLNASAAEILKCCNGANSVDQIVTELETKFETSGLRTDIEGLLAYAYAQHWIS